MELVRVSTPVSVLLVDSTLEPELEMADPLPDDNEPVAVSVVCVSVLSTTVNVELGPEVAEPVLDDETELVPVSVSVVALPVKLEPAVVDSEVTGELAGLSLPVSEAALEPPEDTEDSTVVAERGPDPLGKVAGEPVD